MSTTTLAVNLIIIGGSVLFFSVTLLVTTIEAIYKRMPWLWGIKEYKLWKKAMTLEPCTDVKLLQGNYKGLFGRCCLVNYNGSTLKCFVYETLDGIWKCCIYDEEKPDIVFTSFWNHHSDLLLKRLMPIIIEN